MFEFRSTGFTFSENTTLEMVAIEINRDPVDQMRTPEDVQCQTLGKRRKMRTVGKVSTA